MYSDLENTLWIRQYLLHGSALIKELYDEKDIECGGFII